MNRLANGILGGLVAGMFLMGSVQAQPVSGQGEPEKVLTGKPTVGKDGKDAKGRFNVLGRRNRPNRDGSKFRAGMSEEQKANLETLKGDLLAIKDKSGITPEMKDSLKASIGAMRDGATKPDPEAVDKLAGDLQAALADKTISDEEKAFLAEDLGAVVTSANIPPEEAEAFKQDLEAILVACNVTQEDVETIKADLEALRPQPKENADAASTGKSKIQDLKSKGQDLKSKGQDLKSKGQGSTGTTRKGSSGRTTRGGN